MQIEYAGGPNPGFIERRNVNVPEHLVKSVERRNAELRKHVPAVVVPVVPDLTDEQQTELRARTKAVLGLL